MPDRDPPGVFLSYRRADVGQQVMHLVQALQPPLADEQIFYDRESLRAGDRWKERLREEVARCSVFLALIGPKWLGIRNPESGQRRLDEPDDWVRTEIEFALERVAAGDLVFVPVLLGDASLPQAEYLPPKIQALCNQQAKALRTVERAEWERDVGELLAVITEHVPAREAAPLAIDVDTLELEAVHFANEARQSFTVTNVSKATQKVALSLVVSSVDPSDRPQLQKAGAILEEFELKATLGEPGTVDLFEGGGHRLVLAPEESDAFRLKLSGEEGWKYRCHLQASCRNVETRAEATAVSPDFVAEFPIRSIELLRARRSKEK